MFTPVQELPTAYKSVRLYCLPLRGRRGHVPALQGDLDEKSTERGSSVLWGVGVRFYTSTTNKKYLAKNNLYNR